MGSSFSLDCIWLRYQTRPASGESRTPERVLAGSRRRLRRWVVGSARPSPARWLVRSKYGSGERHAGSRSVAGGAYRGHNITYWDTEKASDAGPPWLDPASAALLRDIVATLVREYTDLLAAILYGSIARHDERPLDATNPSDLDVLVIFDTDDEPVTVHWGLCRLTSAWQCA